MTKLKKIAISGGKGGTGKSTIAVLMANRLVQEGKRVVLCDCDVECPNDYLLLNQKLSKPKEWIYADYPTLDKRKCNKCGLCVKACQNNAIFQAKGEYPVFIGDLCSGCGACQLVCPRGAINMKKKKTGEIYQNKIKNQFWLITGLAKAGLEETGATVDKSKQFAINFAVKMKADYILFDTAAGTHCPVISALLDCDFAYIVTEPTPMGAMDLGLILSLCQKLKIPVKIILNQADLGDKKKVEEVVKRYKTKIYKEIPYSKELVEAYSRGRLLEANLIV